MRAHLQTRKLSRYLPSCVSLLALIVFTCVTAFAQGKDYTSIVVFGDSLSDTGNVAHLTQMKYGIRIPGTPADYTDGRFTDEYDTIPAARNYFGVWIEQFAAAMPSHPEVTNSLDGGTNYAYGFATTGTGTGAFTFGPSDSLSVDVENMGQQITDYLATKPKINNSTLFVIWGGANDLIHATSANAVATAAIEEAVDIQRLIQAGATQFLVLNLPPLGLIPRENGSPVTSVPATMAAEVFNAYLASGLSALHDFIPAAMCTCSRWTYSRSSIRSLPLLRTSHSLISPSRHKGIRA